MTKINSVAINLAVKGQVIKQEMMEKLKEKDGSFFTENALVIVILVAIAGVVLMSMFNLFKDTLMPELESKITEFFNFAG